MGGSRGSVSAPTQLYPPLTVDLPALAGIAQTTETFRLRAKIRVPWSRDHCSFLHGSNPIFVLSMHTFLHLELVIGINMTQRFSKCIPYDVPQETHQIKFPQSDNRIRFKLLRVVSMLRCCLSLQEEWHFKNPFADKRPFLLGQN